MGDELNKRGRRGIKQPGGNRCLRGPDGSGWTARILPGQPDRTILVPRDRLLVVVETRACVHIDILLSWFQLSLIDRINYY